MQLVVADLEKHFSSLKKTGKSQVRTGDFIDLSNPQQTPEPQNDWSAISVDHSNFGSYTRKMKKTAAGVSYGQPQFFSPVYTPINWQIPSRRREIYMWGRFWYENEPRVATAIDFYSKFPMTSFETECSNRYVKHFFDEQVNKKLNLDKWNRMISHEVHLLGDCFPFLEIDCPTCGGSGRVGDRICEHEGGSFKRLLILNPDFVEVFTNSIAPEDVITYVPDDELRDIVLKNGPGTEKLSPQVRQMIAEGRPIPLDNRSVSHLKFGESGYRRYGISMIRRLFPILSYKTKIMTAQWIVAERLILPIKIVKVGTEDRPASEADIAAVQSQLMATSNDPNLCLVTHHAFELDWVGAAGKILQVQGEYEFINQEIMDGFGLNKQLITGEGPSYASAAMGAEIMIRRLESWRQELKRWIEEKIYRPIAKMKGFVEKNEWGEDEYIYPKVKWDSLNLRDRQGERTMIMQLYDKGLVSAQRVLEEFDIDPDTEFERMRYEKIEMMTQEQPGQMPGGEGGMGGLDLGGGGGLGMGGGMEGAPGGELGGMEGGMGGMEGGGMGGGMEGGMGGAPMAASDTLLRTSQSGLPTQQGPSDPGQYGGKILTEKSRAKIDKERTRLERQQPTSSPSSGQGGTDGFIRDEKGRIMLTSIERDMMKAIEQRQRNKQITHSVYSSYEVYVSGRPVLIDLAFPDIKIAIECDGSTFHGSPEQQGRDKARDKKLNNLGWQVLRFNEKEIQNNIGGVMRRVVEEISKREVWINKERKNLAEKSKNDKLGQ